MVSIFWCVERTKPYIPQACTSRADPHPASPASSPLASNMSGFYPTLNAPTNFQQDFHYRNPWTRYAGPTVRDVGERRNAPREPPFKEYDPIHGGWWQGARKLRGFRPSLYWTRPSDGKRRGAAGRLKEVLTGEGPDVYITIGGDRRTLMRDRPRRDQWAGWGLTASELQDRRSHDRDWRPQDEMPIHGMSWTGHRGTRGLYNYRTREFITPWRYLRRSGGVWTNVDWPQGAKDRSRLPLSVRDVWGEWWSRVDPYAGEWPGGRPRPWWSS